MIFAHLPSGYILARSAPSKFSKRWTILAALIGSIFPDIDLAYYWTFGTASSHHDYFTHLPVFWAVVTLGLFLCRGRSILTRKQIQISAVFLSAVWLHLILDTVCGAIAWMYPFSQTKFSFFTHGHPYNFWLWNEVFSWTFSFEFLIFAIAGIVYVQGKRSSGNVASDISVAIKSSPDLSNPAV
jgi:inner membrane protein